MADEGDPDALGRKFLDGGTGETGHAFVEWRRVRQRVYGDGDVIDEQIVHETTT